MTDRKTLEAALETFDGYTAAAWSPFIVDLASAARERLAQMQGDALVIEKVNGEWPQWAIDLLEQYHYPCPPEFQEQIVKWLPTDLLDALANPGGGE